MSNGQAIWLTVHNLFCGVQYTLFSVYLDIHNKIYNINIDLQQFTLGIASLSKLGWAGATLEAFLILYLHAASLTGLSIPMRALRVLPRARRTPLTRIIALCTVLLAHSTAQPLLVKILGKNYSFLVIAVIFECFTLIFYVFL